MSPLLFEGGAVSVSVSVNIGQSVLCTVCFSHRQTGQYSHPLSPL